MFCGNCGQAIEEGRRFCKNCGAPVPPGAEGIGGGGGGGYGTGWPAPQGPGPKGGRTGLIVGSVAAAIIVLAGLGVGLYFGLRDDGGGAMDKTDLAVSTTKTTGSDVTGGGTSTSGSGISTTETIPHLTSTTEGPTATTAGSTTTTATTMTTTTADLLGDWYAAEAALAVELESDDTRIPELAEAINSSAPDVPDMVYDELAGMLGRLAPLTETMDETAVPEGYEDAHSWLMKAANHMYNRIQATMHGITVMWSTGSVNAATADFDEGRAERDAYREAIDKHWNALPSG